MRAEIAAARRCFPITILFGALILEADLTDEGRSVCTSSSSREAGDDDDDSIKASKLELEERWRKWRSICIFFVRDWELNNREGLVKKGESGIKY